MRWLFFIPAALAGVVIQTTVGQLLWFRTPVGWVGPELLAAAAVYSALYASNRVDAVLSAWILGFAVDLTLSGPGMGLLALLYAAGGAGIFGVRDVFFREKVLTRMALGFAFCAFVYGLWTAYNVVAAGTPGRGYFDPALQVMGLSIYTAILTPLVCAAVRGAQGLLPSAVRAARRR